MKSVDFLDAVRDRHGIPSDNKTAKFLDIPQGTIAGIRTGRRKFTGHECQKIAQALDLPDGYVLARIEAERSPDPGLRKVWIRVAESVLASAKKGHAAGLALLAVGALCTGSNAEASPSHASSQGAAAGLYIMLIRWCKRIRTWLTVRPEPLSA